ncbi:hypothetical protein TeGR_g12943 [Tetraparma gracilis]|uniref:START domain-containing protein n=1 Tax=Tetraparma gracilis TaxID=2962635 RepID=A0ABQ6MU35_9STRA|nr:hypothetical protein TeGR_g12943 [Tetraparma gracilis]
MCNLQDVFERDEEIDGAEWSVFEQAIKMRLDEEGGEREKGGGRERDELDEELVPRVKAKFDTLKGVERRELEHSDYRFQLKKYAALNGDEIVGKFASDTADSTSTSTGSTMTLSSTSTPASKKKRDDGELVVGSASAVVDASIERCAAWAFAEAARLRTKDGDGSHRIRCDERPEDSQSQLVDTAYKLPGGKLLTFTTKAMWSVVSEDEVVVAFEHAEDAGCSARCTALLTCTRRDAVGEVQLTDISLQLAIRANLSGRGGGGALTRFLEMRLARVSVMRGRFDQSLEVDSLRRKELVEMIRGHALQQVDYSEEEEKIVAEGETLFKAFDGLKSKDVGMRSPQSKGKVVYKKGDPRAWGWSTATVRASSEEVLAHVWDVEARNFAAPDDLEREVDDKPNSHSQLVYIKKQTPAVISNRDFLGRAVWKKVDGGFVVVTAPEESTKRPANNGRGNREKSSAKGDLAVRGTYPSIMRISPINGNETKLEYAIHPTFGGGVPPIVFNRYMGSNLVFVTDMQEYFLQMRGMSDHDNADGRALGYRLTYPDEKNKTTPSKAVARIVKLHKGLSQLSQEYPWIVAFLQEVLKGGLHRNKAVSTKLECLSEAEARRIGKNLPQALRARKTAGAGVLQWKNQNPSMAELFEKHQWAEEMVETMGEELLKNAAWGLWFRVITGSGLSMVDLATDINVILVYFEEGQNGYGWMMLGMVLASMGLQLVLVVMQNWKMGWGKLLREVLIVVSGLKPGVDAMRVVSNAEMHEHHMMTAKIELVFTKGIEMFCESIPGCILQVTALIQGGSREQMATKVLSIIVSAITTGMGSASISYDFDSDPEGRRILPSFYGYLPDDGNKRTIMYFCMVLNSALLLLLRSIGAALLMLVDTKMFVAYMAGDQLLYLLQKLVRGDFLHWVPVEGVGGLAWALLERVIVKTLTDFTGIIQFRAPGEMGGASWLWSMCLALAAPWVAVPVHFDSLTSNSTDATDEEDGGETSLDFRQSDAWRLLGGLTAGWVLAFAVFLGLMKKKYRSTFWSMETGNEWIQSYFLQGKNDAIKMNVVKFNKGKWEAIEPQVKEWVREGWMGWERDKPEWFSDYWKSQVPADWVPKEGKAEHAKARRRSIAGSARKGSVLFGPKIHGES